MARSVLLVDATDLALWADRRDAQSRLPELLRRLALATLRDSIQAIAFRGGEGVQLPGWDGVIQASSGNAFVPAGHSTWEAGTDSDIKGKADDDYEKRTADPLGVTPTDATFIFVTPRRWKNKSKWSRDKRKEGIWKDVRAYDADDIQTWLEQAPGVHVWISNLLAKHPGSAEDLLTFWETWSTVTQPRLSAELVTAGRKKCIEELRAWLAGQPSAIAVRGETAEEAIAFVAGALQQLPETERDRAFSRGLVVSDIGAWQAFASSTQPLLMIPIFADRARTPAAVGFGHHVLIPQGRNEPALGATVDLPRLRTADAKTALLALGVGTDQEAERLALLGRASTGALRRKLAVHPASLIPKWAAADVARQFLPALLAGRWNDESAADREILAGLAGTSYADYRKLLQRWSNEADPPVRQIGTLWTVVAKEDAWALLAHHLTDEDLQRLESAAIKAIGELDPKFELTPDERWQAAFQGKVPTHSHALREGLADTLAVMAASTDIFPLQTTSRGQDVANRIVRRLLDNATTWQALASMSGEIRLLAEAAPDVFLSFVDRISEGSSPIAKHLFSDGDPLFSTSPHTNLLWALESLAWSPNYLGHAALVLAKLDRIDPGGKTQNRPANSLREIFLLWHPSTSASAEQRLQVVDNVCKREPRAGWKLLTCLVPQAMGGFASSTAKPLRRDWAPDEPPTVTRGELYTGTVEVLRRMRQLAGTDGERWKSLIEALDDIPDREFDAVIRDLAAIEPDNIKTEDRIAIWSTLRNQLSRHREFPDAAWALPAEKLADLETQYKRFEPSNPVERSIWLFGSSRRLPRTGLSDWKEHHRAVEEAQLAAVDEILASVGLAGVFDLAKRVENPGEVGRALGRSSLPVDEPAVLDTPLKADEHALRSLRMGFILARSERDGIGWQRAMRERPAWSSWTAHQKADYFLTLPANATTWHVLSGEDEQVQRLYWMTINIYTPDLSAEEVEHATRRLMDFGLHARAIDFLAMQTHRNSDHLDANLVLALLEGVAEGKDDKEQKVNWGSLAYDVGQLLDVLEKAASVDDLHISRLEWFFLPLLRHQRPATKLQQALASSPTFFVDLLKLIFKPRHGEPRELSEADIARARYGYELLDEWTRLPGLTGETDVDVNSLRQWVTAARQEAAAADRAEIADVKIGELFSHAPNGSDDLWPHEAVREILEEVASDDVDSGLRVGVYNSRGVVTRAVGEGGKQERQIADRYRQYARAFADRWPRTSRVMTAIADGYTTDARREDTRAELEEEMWATRRPIRPGPRIVNPAEAASLNVDVTPDDGDD